jgi:DNA-binding transcriptional ArsR family regulator
MVMIAYDQLSLTFQALGDPTRLRILSMLAKGEKTVSELSKPFKMSMPAITKHLKVLEKAGLISRGKDAQYRPCKLEAKNLEEANVFIENQRKIWEDRFDRLDSYLEEIQNQNKKLEKKNGKRK